MTQVKRQVYDINFLKSSRSTPVQAIDNLNIPNISIPACLQGKKRVTQGDDTIARQIRPLFNNTTSENVVEVKEKLRKLVIEKAQTVELLNEVATEIFQLFLISEANIPNYIQLLNAIHNAAVLIPDPKTKEKKASLPIKYYFIELCKNTIFQNISVENIRKLAEMDQDDDDQLDEYNKKRGKMLNLVMTLCVLYDQRGTTNIHITSKHLSSCLVALFDFYTKIYQEYCDQINPETGECRDTDYDEHEILARMLTLYAEHLYIFMFKEKNSFKEDPAMNVFVDRFQKEIMTTLTMDHLISRCTDLFLNETVRH